MKNESFKHLVNERFTRKALVIYHTTSKKCKEHEKAKTLDEDGKHRKLKITMKDRGVTNGIFYLIYRLLRSFYVSIFFYFLPYSVVIISTLIPTLYRTNIMNTNGICLPYGPNAGANNYPGVYA